MKIKKYLLASIISLILLFSASAVAVAQPEKSKVKVTGAKLTLVDSTPTDAASDVAPKPLPTPAVEKEKLSIEVKAPEEPGLGWWQVLLKNLINLVFSVLGVMFTILVTVLAKKYGFEAHTEKVNDVLERSSNYAEQWAIKKAKLDKSPQPSAAKMEMAVNFAIDLAKDYKLPSKGSTWWEDQIESWLSAKPKK